MYIRSCVFCFYDNTYWGKVGLLKSCVSTTEKSTVRKRCFPTKKRIFKCKSASAGVNSRTGSAENGILKWETSLGASPRTNDKQREISDMDGKTTRQWEEHKKIEIQGRMNCLRNNNGKIGVMKKMLDEAGLYGSIPPGKEERHPTPPHTHAHAQILVMVFYLKDKEKNLYIFRHE